MSVYNCEKYLSHSIESIINQTYSHFEFIIINDGSTDDSFRIIKRYEDNDPRIIVIDQKNVGLTKALNNGIQIAKGDYIARMDADDISLSDRFKNFVKYREIHKNLEIYTTPAMTINSFGNTLGQIPGYLRRTGFNKKMLDYSNSLIHGTLIIKSEVIKRFGYNEDYKFAQEFNLYHFLIAKGYKINYDQNNISYLLRVHEDQVTKLNSKSQNNLQIELYYKTLKEFNKKIYKNNIINRIRFKVFDLYFFIQTKRGL